MKMGKNKTLQSEERTLILKVLKFFEAEKTHGDILIPVDKVLSRTCAATGVSKSTVMRIRREERRIIEAIRADPSNPSTSNIVLPTPGKKRKPKKNKIIIDDFTVCALRNIVNNYYAIHKQKPTLKKVLEVAKRDLNFPGQREMLRKILIEKLGFRFKQCTKKKEAAAAAAAAAAAMERPPMNMPMEVNMNINKNPYRLFK